MTFVGNLLWFVLGGFAMFIQWALLGVLLSMTIVGIPFAFAAFRIAGFAAFPFGRELVDVEILGEKRVLGTGVGNAVWIVCAGLWLALAHAILGVVLCCSLFGIPFGIAHLKLAQACFAPLGKRVVTTEMATAAKRWYHDALMQQRYAPQFGMAPRMTAAQMSAPAPLKFCHACGRQVPVTSPVCSNCRSPQRPI